MTDHDEGQARPPAALLISECYFGCPAPLLHQTFLFVCQPKRLSNSRFKIIDISSISMTPRHVQHNPRPPYVSKRHISAISHDLHQVPTLQCPMLTCHLSSSRDGPRLNTIPSTFAQSRLQEESFGRKTRVSQPPMQFSLQLASVVSIYHASRLISHAVAILSFP